MTTLILLSTYNGEKYLSEQLDSIIAQTHTDWTLLIRDDGSSDDTLNIIKEYCDKDTRIELTSDTRGNLKSCQSFAALMEAALLRDEAYIFFSDQDDVWLPEKLEKSIAEFESLEQKHGKDTPALVHTDLQVVDDKLKLIHPSYLRYEGLKRNPKSPIRTLLINNYVTGCTMGINRALLNVATPVPKTAFMHDWWCALCAAANGHIGFVSEATILYRQHRSNAIGSSGLLHKIKTLIAFKGGFSHKLKNLRTCIDQAQSLLSETSTAEKTTIIKRFTHLPNQSIHQRYINARKLQLLPASPLRNAAFLLMLAFV